MTHYTRKEWGAVPPKRITPIDTNKMTGICIHYFGLSIPSPKHGADIVQRVQHSHMYVRNWNDGAYNEVVDLAGDSFEMRGYKSMSAAEKWSCLLYTSPSPRD